MAFEGPDPLLRFTIAEALAHDYIYLAHCRCGHSREIDLTQFAADEWTRDIAKRLRCECGARRPIIAFMPREWHQHHFARK